MAIMDHPACRLICSACVVTVLSGCSSDPEPTVAPVLATASPEEIARLKVPFDADQARKAVLTFAQEHRFPTRIRFALSADESIAMRLIPPGSVPFHGDVATVQIPFYIAETELTVAQYRQSGLSGLHDHPRLSEPRMPASFLHHDTVDAYLDHLNRRFSISFRCPTDVEWEFAARAGVAGRYSADPTADPTTFANISQWNAAVAVNGYERRGKESARENLFPVASFPANGFGLHDVLGNIHEVVLIPPARQQRGDSLLTYTMGGAVQYSNGFSERNVEHKTWFAPFVGLRLAITADESLSARLAQGISGVSAEHDAPSPETVGATAPPAR